MSSQFSQESPFIIQVKVLLAKVHTKSIVKDSLVERASFFYENQQVIQHIKDNFNEELSQLNAELDKKTIKDKKFIKNKIVRVKKEQTEYLEKLSIERNERNQYLLSICQEILALCEGESFGESNRKSAKLLGAIQLLSPTEGKSIAIANEQNKPIYKAVLALRLLDCLCMDKKVTGPYIKKYMGTISSADYVDFAQISADEYKLFVSQVKIPVIMAAILQDIGNYHFDAQKIICGDNGDKDPHRMLEVDERKKLLQINYRETLTYLIEGIGLPKYIGNSKADRNKFNEQERNKLLFIKQLLKSSINPKESVGNLLKVPQIYTSIILSIKDNYNYKLLPKVYNALNQNAERGNCSQFAVDALRKVTGDFPQGFGVIYIPKDSSGRPYERYEYAIVNALYPKKANEPICRSTTRNLAFISYGADFVVKEDSNLYFPGVVKQLTRMSKDRLHEILELLSSNYNERKQLDLVPRCWHTQEFFSLKKNQNICNKS